MNPGKLILKQGKTALLICDVQQKFSKVIFEFDKLVTNTSKLINVCKILQVPMIVTEQNPTSLGPTVPEFDISTAKGPFPKTQFSMCTPEVMGTLSTLCSGNRPDSVLLVGLEGHVCIENSAIDLRNEGYEVHAVADCISSRIHEDTLLALNRMQQIGCFIATSENVIFKLLGNSDHEHFKKILGLVRVPSAYIGSVASPKL